MYQLLLALLLLPLLSVAQPVVSLSYEKQWLFSNIEQQLYLQACEVPLSEIAVYSNQEGKLDLQSDGSFTIKPYYGRCELKIFQYQQQDSVLLKKVRLSVKALPQPIASLGGVQEALSKNEFLAQRGIRVELINYDYNIHFTVEKYTLMVIREQKLLYFEEQIGGRFTAPMKQKLASILQGGEQILITNITFRSPFHYYHTANSITFSIKNKVVKQKEMPSQK